MVAHAKTARTFYDEARMATMAANLKKYEWARDVRRGYVKDAEAWAARDDAFLRGMVISPQVPRCYDLHNLGCPVHGLEANKNGLYTWGYSIDRPFKIKCPAGGEEYPSNDFAAYLASGMKDRSLLTGDYADDGWGWNKPGDNHNYWFVAYYAHWSMQRELQRALRALSMGALVADDPAQARRFAHKCAVLLWQLATYYPDYDYNKQGREAKEHNPHYTGRITNMIWEVGWADVCAPAYDAIWPFLQEDRELQALAGLDGPGLDNFIRDRLLMTMARDITSSNGRNQGNYGMHQQALIRLALALDEQTASPTSAEMVNWVLANPRPRTNSDYGLVDALENMVYRDGVPLESPGYNYLWTNAPAGIASVLGDKGKHLLAHPRFRALLKWHYETIVAGMFQPPLGDSGDMFARPGSPSDTVLRLAVELLRDPRAAADLRKHVDRPGDLFTDPPAEMLQGSLEAPPPAVPARSHLLPGYGLGFLEAGEPGKLTGLALHYGSWGHHMHRDQLALLLFAHDNALLCDAGYPEQTDAFNHRRYGIWANTISHNTVTVDARGQRRGEGRLHAFEPRGFAQVVDASCDSYEGVSRYRRAAMLIEAAPEQSYVFDVFHVCGGRQHDWALMGPQADFSCSPPLGPVQERGTLAGVDVPYEQFYDDPALKDKPLGSTACSGYNGSGFQFFVHVQRAALRGEAVAEWKLTEPRPGQPARPWQGLGVRTHVVGTDEELIAADCQPQRYQRMPEWVKHLIRRRTGQDLRSAFVSVHEPYAGSPWIESVTAAPVMPSDGEAVAVMVRLKNGERHYCFHSLVPGRKYVVDGKLRVDGQAACLVLDAAGKPRQAMLLNGTALRYGKLSLQGAGLRHSRLKRADYAHGVLELTDPVLGKDLKPGQTVIVRTKGSSETVTLQKVLSPTQLSIGDEDLRVAGGPVNEVIPDKHRIVSSVSYAPHAREGMTVLNSRGEIQGRLAGGDQFTLDRTGLPPLTAACFPAGSDGLGARFAVVIAGPGDEVILPSLTLYQARPPQPCRRGL